MRGMRSLLLLVCLLLTSCAPQLPDTARGLLLHLGALEDRGIECPSEQSCNGYTSLTPGVIGEKLGQDLTQTPDGGWELDDGHMRVVLLPGEGVRFLSVILRP